jgi:hypothetical protein
MIKRILWTIAHADDEWRKLSPFAASLAWQVTVETKRKYAGSTVHTRIQQEHSCEPHNTTHLQNARSGGQQQ